MSAAPAQRPGSSKQDYATPRDFLTAVKIKLRIQQFDHDFAADANNTKSPYYWDARINSLAQPPEMWADQLVAGWSWGWLNPPFSDIAPWAERCAQVRAIDRSIAFLVPAGVGSNWFRDHVDQHARVLALNGRLAFIEGRPKELYPKDCILCLYSPWVAPGFEVWNWRETLTSVEGLITRYRMAQADHLPPDEFTLIGHALKDLNTVDQTRYYEGINGSRD